MNKFQKIKARRTRAAAEPAEFQIDLHPVAKSTGNTIDLDKYYIISGTELEVISLCLQWCKPLEQDSFCGLKPQHQKQLHSNLGQVLARTMLRGVRQ